MTITRIGFAPRRAGLSMEEAQTHWATRHAEVARGLPGLKRYWQMHAVLRDGRPLLPWAGFDCCSELDYESLPAIDASFTSDHYFAEVQPDETALLDKTKGGNVTTQRHLLEGEVDPGRVRLVLFMRAAPLRSGAALAEGVRTLPHPANARARELFVALDGPAAAQRVGLYDVVESLWFDDAGAALAFALSSEQAERRRAIADLVRGVDQLIATIRIVK